MMQTGAVLMPLAQDEPGEKMVSLNRYAEAHRAKVREGRVREVNTTSDFAWLADLTDRDVMRGYMEQDIPTTWQTLGFRRDTKDLARANGKGRGRDYELDAPRLIPPVYEKGEYLPLDTSDTYYEFKTFKYGCQWDLSWESWLADERDLNLLKQHPYNWGLSAKYTREYLFTAAWAANTTLFTAWHGNIMTGAGGQLDGDNLDTAITAIRGFSDPAGNVLPYLGPLYLVVPPALERTARNLIASGVRITGSDVIIPAGNPMQNACQVVVNHFLPTLDATYGNTGWYLFCDPRMRPAVRYGYLRGYETPEIFVKAADAQRLLGGGADPFEGSFLDDDIAFKLRFTFGADTVDWRGAYWSRGEAEAG